MAFTDSFDAILARILLDHQGQDPTVDISKGSVVFIKSASLASAIWGLNQDGAYVDAQRFADSCDEDTLDHYIVQRGMQVVPGEAKAAKRIRVQYDIRFPPAGGNRYDYIRWAKEASPLVKTAWCVPRGQGPGTVDVIILADAAQAGSEIPSAALVATVLAYITNLIPETVQFLRVLAPEVVTQAVTIARISADYPVASAIIDVTAYMASMEPGMMLYQDQLKLLGLGGGAGAAPVTVPAADVPTTPYQMIRPGAINVT
jgi:uncharacterized phage protein gp47/JayE